MTPSPSHRSKSGAAESAITGRHIARRRLRVVRQRTVFAIGPLQRGQQRLEGCRSPWADAAASASSTRWLRGMIHGFTRRMRAARCAPSRAFDRAARRQRCSQGSTAEASANSARKGLASPAAASARRRQASVKSTPCCCSSASQSCSQRGVAVVGLLQAELGALALQQRLRIQRGEVVDHGRHLRHRCCTAASSSARPSAAAALRPGAPGSSARSAAGCRRHSARCGRCC